MAAALSGFAQPAAEGLTPEDSIRLRQCRDNLAPTKLFPDTALSCSEFLKADGGRVLREFGRVDSPAALDLLAKTAALADLGTLVSDPSYGVSELGDSLDLILPCEYTPLCSLTLGPEPEKVLAWVERVGRKDGRFSDERKREIAKAIYHWDSLDEAFREGRGRENWLKLDIKKRTKAYREWIRAQCQDLNQRKGGKEEARRLSRLMEEEMPLEAAGPLRHCAERFKAAAEGRVAPDQGLDRGYSKAADQMKEIGDGQGADQFGALGKSFDGANAGAVVSVPDPPPPGTIGAEQTHAIIEALKKPLAAELRDTIVGRKLLEFYEGPTIKDSEGNILNAMNLDFQRFGDVNAVGKWEDNRISFSLAHLEAWMQKSKQTPETLLADKNALAALSRNLGPIFVHEGTHQTQTAFFKLNGLSRESENVEEEVGGAVSGALFVEEKLQKRGSAYVQDLSSLDNRLHGVYDKNGIKGLRRDRIRTYLDLGFGSKFSLDRTAAMMFGNRPTLGDYQHAASFPKGSKAHDKMSKEFTEKIDKFGLLLKKYQDDETWFRSVRERLADGVGGSNP